jgi:hypothetical protein
VKVTHFGLFADGNDFNETAVEFVFPAGGARVVTPIGTFDDVINEANQVFVAYLEILDAVNTDLIGLPRSKSYCNIVDNDSKSDTQRSGL